MPLFSIGERAFRLNLLLHFLGHPNLRHPVDTSSTGFLDEVDLSV